MCSIEALLIVKSINTQWIIEIIEIIGKKKYRRLSWFGEKTTERAIEGDPH